jgi:hypothetical protein
VNKYVTFREYLGSSLIIWQYPCCSSTSLLCCVVCFVLPCLSSCCVFCLSLFIFVLCLICPMLSVYLDCPFVIALSVSSNLYFTGYWPLIFSDVLPLACYSCSESSSNTKCNFAKITCPSSYVCYTEISRRPIVVKRYTKVSHSG